MAIDYNAAFTGAVARLVDFYDNMKPFSDCTLDLGWTHPNATLVRPTCAFSSDVRGADSIVGCIWIRHDQTGCGYCCPKHTAQLHKMHI